MSLRKSQFLKTTSLFLIFGTILTGCDAQTQTQKNDAPAIKGPETNSKPNIVLIMADDLGYGDLSSYGHPNIKTPIIDNLASDGIKLTSFYAGEPVCTPSRAALMTGRYAIRSDMTGVEFPDSDHGMPPVEITLAETLREQNYQTAVVGKWHLGDKSPFMPTENGFDSYFGLLYSNDMIEPWITVEMEAVKDTPPPLMMVRGTEPEYVVEDQGVLTKAYTNEAVRRIKNFSDDEPFFLYLAYSMPHLPVAAPDEFLGKSNGGLYGDVIQTIDWSVGEVLAALEERNELDNTIFVFTSDNGPWHNLPARMVQNGVEAWHVGSTGTLRGSKGTTYEGGLRVPAIVKWPNANRKGIVSSELVTAMDLFSTLAEAGGALNSNTASLDGKDLKGLFTGDIEESSTGEFFYFRGKRLEAVRDETWKLRISRYTEKNVKIDANQNPILELFNLDEDPSERFNVAERNPDVVARLRTRLVAFSKETGAELAFSND